MHSYDLGSDASTVGGGAGTHQVWRRAGLLGAAIALALMCVPQESHAGPLEPSFVTRWNEATKAYRFADFKKARTTIAPLLATGFALDDGIMNFWFQRDAAYIYCMSGSEPEARNFAQRGVDFWEANASTAIPGSPYFPAEDGVVKRALNVGYIHLSNAAFDGGFDFSVPGLDSDYIQTSGRVVDRNRNGKLDDVGVIDLGGGVRTSPAADNTVVLNLNGINDHCGERIPQTLGLANPVSKISVNRAGRGGIRLSCTSTVTCGGLLTVRRGGKRLAWSRYVLDPGKKSSVRFRLNQRGCALLDGKARGVRTTVAITAGDPDHPIREKIRLKRARGCRGLVERLKVKFVLKRGSARRTVSGPGCTEGTYKPTLSDSFANRIKINCREGSITLKTKFEIDGNTVTGGWSRDSGTRKFGGFSNEASGVGKISLRSGGSLVFSGTLRRAEPEEPLIDS